MGKWRGGISGGPKKGGSALTNMRGGYGGIMGTCDAGREIQCSKELVNVFGQVIEWLQEKGELESSSSSASTSSAAAAALAEVASNDDPEAEAAAPETQHKSIHMSLADEIKQLKAAKRDRGGNEGGRGQGDRGVGAAQRIKSIDSGMKGVVMVQIMAPNLCPVELVRGLFRRTREEGVSFTRHVVRIIPLRHIGFPDLDSLENCVARGVLAEYFPRAAEEYRNRNSSGSATSSSRSSSSEDSVQEKRDEAAEVKVNEDAATAASTEVLDEPAGKRQRLDSNSMPETEETEEVESGAAATGAASVLLPSSEQQAPARRQEERRVTPASPASMALVPAVTHYTVLYKNRNSSDALKRHEAQNTVLRLMPKGSTKSNYIKPDSALVVEAVRNILGVAFVPDFPSLHEFNIRKFQEHTLKLKQDQKQQQAQEAAVGNASSSGNDTNGAGAEGVVNDAVEAAPATSSEGEVPHSCV